MQRLRVVPIPLLACLAALAVGCRANVASTQEPPYPAVESASFGSMRNVSLSGQIWFGAAPQEADLELAGRRGVRTVIDLSATDEHVATDAGDIVRRLGMQFYHPDVPSDAEPTDETVDLVLAIMARHEAEPMLMYCGSGSRCATFVAIYRAVHVGVPLDLALVEARRAGMRPQDEDFVRAQVERLL